MFFFDGWWWTWRGCCGVYIREGGKKRKKTDNYWCASTVICRLFLWMGVRYLSRMSREWPQLRRILHQNLLRVIKVAGRNLASKHPSCNNSCSRLPAHTQQLLLYCCIIYLTLIKSFILFSKFEKRSIARTHSNSMKLASAPESFKKISSRQFSKEPRPTTFSTTLFQRHYWNPKPPFSLP